MSQHALQPVLPGRGGVDGQCGPAVHHRHGGSRQEVIGHLYDDLPTQGQRNVTITNTLTRSEFIHVLPTVG